MAKIVFSAVVGDARKKVGGVVFTKVRSGAIVRRKVSPIQPRSSFQRNVRADFTSLSKSWGGLSDSQRSGWIALAALSPRKDVFGASHTLTGLQLYQSCNRNLASLGLPAISDPPPNLQAGYPGLLTLSTIKAGTAVLTGVTFAAGSNTYAYSSAPGRVPTIGDTVVITGFANPGNNGTFVIASVVPATSFTVVDAAGITEPLAASATVSPPFTVNPATYNTAAEGWVIYAAAQQSPGRAFVGKRYRIVQFGLTTLAAPVDITANYGAKFGVLVSGKKVSVLLAYITQATGGKGTPSAQLSTVA